MPKLQEKALTYEMVITEIIRSASGPLPAQELAAKMLSVLPSSARNPQQAMRQHIRQANGKQLVFLDADIILPLRLAYQGARFRIPLERESFDKGLLPLDNISSYLPQGFQVDRLQLVDASGNVIPFQIKRITRKVQSPFGLLDETYAFANLSAWHRAQKMYIKDHILVTILDWEQGVLQLEREPFSQRNLALLAKRDLLLAEMFFGLLEGADREQVYIHAVVPTVYARMPDKSGYPPSHWMDVIAADERMTHDDWRIIYSDQPQTLFERMMGNSRPQHKKPVVVPLSSEQRQMVYCFKAHLLYRPKIWREIEIQGKQTLADLDLALRGAFNHDEYDHLGGFWKLIPRAAQAKTMSKRSSGRPARTREVEIGDVEPMGGGDGANIKVAELGLALGEQLKYVYDFGDWIEHQLTLQAIEAPQGNINYPREVARNQPEYALCVECQKKGKQQVAKWICLECTTGAEQEILLCEKCADKHEDHYLEEILY